MAYKGNYMSILEELKKKKENTNNEVYVVEDAEGKKVNQDRQKAQNVGKSGTSANALYEQTWSNKSGRTTTKKEDNDTWFQGSKVFDDGYDFGDITKTILGTTGDIGLNIVKGVANIGEGIGDLGAYGVAGLADLFGQDEYAEKVKKNAQRNLMDELFKPAEDVVEQASILGEKSDSVAQGLGYVGSIMATGGLGSAAGLGTLGTTALTTGLTGFSSMGSGMSEAYQGGATDEEAIKYGIISGVAEAGSELIFGGLGKAVNAVGLSKGLSSLDDALAKKISSKLTSTLGKNIAEYTVKAGAEGVEEVVSGIAQGIGKKVTYMSDEELVDILKDEKLLDQFIVGAVTSGIAQAPGLVKTTNAGRDFISGYTQNEQKVIDVEVESRVNEQQKAGKELTNKEISNIRKQVEQDFEKGYVSTDTIENTLGKKLTAEQEADIEAQLNTLLQQSKTATDPKQIAEIDQQMDILATQLQTSKDLDFSKDAYIQKSYQEKALRKEHYKADLTKYDVKQQKTIQKAMDSGILNNTNKTHEFVDMIAKIAADKDISFDFANNEKLKASGFAVEGKTIDGFVSKDSITLNIDSNKALNKVVGHEITHILEGTELYTELQKAVKEYATTKGIWNSRLAEITDRYKSVEGANVENELTSDLVGEYLFTDTDFVNNLSATKPNVFKRIYNEIKYLFKVATAGSTEARQLEKVKRTFEKAYKAQGTQTTGTKYSVSDNQGRTLSKEQQDYFKNSKARDENGNLVTVYHGTMFGGFTEFSHEDPSIGNYRFGDKNVNFFTSDKGMAVSYSDVELYEAERIKTQKLSTMEDVNEVIADKNQELYEANVEFNSDYSKDNRLSLKEENGSITLYDEGKAQHTFKNETDVIRNINSVLRELYGGGEDSYGESYYEGYLNITNPYVVDAKGSNWKFVDKEFSQDIYEKFNSLTQTEKDYLTDLSEWDDYGLFKDTLEEANKTVNVEHNTSVDEETRIYANIYSKLKDAGISDIYSVVLDDFSDKAINQVSIRNLTTNDIVKKALQDGSYDGVIIRNVVDYGSEVPIEKPGDLYVTIGDSNQFKNVDNTNPTTDPDIRYSLSEDTQGRKLSKEQKEYFKNVIPELKDENGNLKVLYHGTPNEFTQFNYDFIGTNGTALGKGFYLTDDRTVAEGYGNVMEVYANITKPMLFEDRSMTKAEYKKFVEAVDKATEGQFLSDYGEVDYEGYHTVLNRALQDYEYGGDDIDLVHGVLNTAGLTWEQGFRILKDTIGYDGVVSNKGFLSKEGTVYIPTLPEQIKSINNLKPTDNPDINLSLSAENEIAPIGQRGTYGKDVRLEIEEAIAPLQETISNLTEQVKTMQESFAPTSQDIVEQQGQEAFKNITDNEAPKSFEDIAAEAMWNEDFESEPDSKVESPLDNRDIDEVGNRKVKAYQYENPDVKPYFQAEAQNMLYDLDNTIKGERIATQDEEGYITGWAGITRQTTEAIAYLKDNYGYSYDQIRKGLNAIIEDDGKENNAVSKRIEFMLDERLREGYTTSDGIPIPANEDYVNFLWEKQVTEYNKEAFNAITDEDIPMYEKIEPRESPVSQETAQGNESIPMKRITAQNQNTEATEGKQRKWVKTSTESEVVNREILPDDLDQDKIMYQPITNKATLNTANVKLDSLGYEKAVEYFNNQILNKKTTVEDIALGERLIQEAIKNKDTKTAGELIQNVAILGTELGQKVQALSIIQRMTPEGQLKMIEKTINRNKVKGDKAFNDVKLTDDMRKKILDTYNQDGSYNQEELNKAVDEVKQEIADQMPSTMLDKVNSWRYLSMLGNPKTHIRNLVSNVAMKGTTAVKNAVARTIETIAPIENRTRTWKMASEDVTAYAQQTALEMKDIISGDSKYNETADIKSKREIFKNKVLNKLANLNSDLLEKEDWWFSKGAFESSFREFLTANGIETKQDIQNNPELIEKGKLYATEQAQIATFRQYSWLANKIRDIESKNAATSIAVGAVLPFKKTPINIAKTGLSYSPLGFAKTLTYDIAQVKKGNMEASTLIDHLAQNTTGTALTLVGYMLAQAGFINGAGDDDKEGKYDYQLGKQSYSINIGGNTYSLSWLSPVAMPLFVGANAYEQLVEGEEWNADVVLETLGQTLDPLSEMSFLSSLDSVLSSYDSGVQRFFGIGEAMIQNYATQFIPTLSSQVAATLDDTKRTTKVSGDSNMKVLEETYNKLIYKIPGLRQTLEPTTDIWGNEVKQSEDLFIRAFENFIAPYSRKENIATEIDEELKDLYSQTGDTGILPSIPSNYVNYDGEKYNMSAKEYTDYKKTYGQTANDLLEDLFRTTTYENATSEERTDMVNDVYDYARDLAKLEYLDKEGVEYTNAKEKGEEVYKENLIKGAIENDMTTEEYGLYVDDPEEYKFLMEKDYEYRRKYFDTSDSLKEIENSFSEDKEKTDDDDELDALYSEKKTSIIDKIIKSGLEDTEKASLYKKYYNSDTVDTVMKSGINIDDYLTYETKEFKADKNEKGNSIPGSRKDKVIAYINSLDMTIAQKAILIKSTNTFKFNDYNDTIVQYVDKLDIGYEDKVKILKDLDFEVDKEGNVYWD